MGQAKSQDRRKAEFVLGVALPALLTLAATAVVVFLGLGRMADEVNAIDRGHAVRDARTALEMVLSRITAGHADYAIWDDTVRNLYGIPDPTFVRENLQDSTAVGKVFDTAFLIDEAGRTVSAFHGGERLPGPAETYLGPGLKRVTDGASPGGRSAATVAFLPSPWGPMAVAAGQVVPYSDLVEIPAGQSRILVLGLTLTAERVGEYGRILSLADLSLSDGQPARGPFIPITDVDDRPIASLAWTDRSPGDEAYANAVPPALGVLALLGGVMAVLVWTSWRNLKSVYRGEEDALHASLHDPLTGLANRAAFQRHLDEALAATDAEAVSVIFVDLDGFKETNDTYGHETGDTLLRVVAAAFRATLGGGGFLARIGGDEFAVVTTGFEAGRRASLSAERMIATLEHPLDIGGRAVAVGASIGIAVADEETMSAVELVRRADVAMYAAKERGKQQAVIYRPELDDQRAERAAVASALLASLRQDDLAVAYQPLVDAATGRLVGVEALVRWTRPGFGAVPPSDFIPIAEEMGIIEELGAWVLRRACRDARQWPSLRVSVNVSPAQFRNPNFEVLVERVLAETGLSGTRLEIEITETFLIAHPDRAQEMLAAVRRLGVSVALDDFGTGFSSIGYLRRFAFDKVKIDRSLVNGMTADKATQKLVLASIALANALGIRVAAEGIETAAEAALLAEAGCHELQGYYFGRPMAAERIPADPALVDRAS
ncbi:bifunctional diguanylate cyclase/phosphodiesterase [Chthonobacter rhizosphaerae]|uniref:bifunctional diguanylate cyclase/phosphodiesterase n=1 Tax=Chthonobacter rhizosphaerae TaxID=2735553 RepID=UPI0015EF04C7|nr:EAL domain-containing protein [Chthonobacter rhizosphaerae]